MSFALIRDRSVAPLLAARLVGNAGDGFGQLALGFGVLELGHGPGGLSAVVACKALPMLLVPAGGVAGDRFRRHRVMAAAEVAAAVAWAGLALCLLGRAPLAVVCGLALGAGLARAVLLPAERGIVADLVPERDRQVANALVGQTVAAGLLVGLGTAGLVVAAAGPGWGAAVKSGTAVAGAVLLGRLRTPARAAERAGPLAELRGGWREFTAHPWVWALTAQFTAVAVAAGAFAGVIGPVYMERGHGGAGAWGLVVAAEASGALLGGLVAVWWRPRRARVVLAVLPVAAAGPMLLAGTGASWAVLAALMTVPGACQTVYGVLWTTSVQAAFPPHVLARVNSWNVLGAAAVTPVAVLAAGPLIEAVGVRAAAAGAGCAVTAVTAGVLASGWFAGIFSEPARGPVSVPGR
ncbi:MFS transporter [Spirillospora sp. NPDC029432]|uniref:MFS transporter n=1 Tax=Spirillospora sp. NPDC029432 TaxID=3154599 RepID=UPI00345312F5